ncbi:spore germination protein [Pradoshia sp.]
MPALVGSVQILNAGSGVIQFGDSLVISPKHASKSVNGSGSGINGGVIFDTNGLSANSVIDLNGVDQPITGNY